MMTLKIIFILFAAFVGLPFGPVETDTSGPLQPEEVIEIEVDEGWGGASIIPTD